MSANTFSSSPVVSRRPLLLGAIAMLAGAGVAARTVGSGKQQTESRAVADFDGLALEGAFDVKLRQGAKEALSITADDNLLPLIETVVESRGGARVLHIRLRRGESIGTRSNLSVVLDVVKLQSLEAAGSGDLRIGPLKTPQLRVALAGSSDARFEQLNTDALDLRIAGSGKVRAAGAAARAKLSITGSGEADLQALAVDDCSISVAGSGDAKVTANQALTVSVAGSGSVEYGGKVTQPRTSVAGSGSVRRR